MIVTVRDPSILSNLDERAINRLSTIAGMAARKSS
jgi:hypothetical protein